MNMFTQLKYFISIVDCHSFTEAAYQNHISQSAISQQIKQLEEELGVQLIRRKNRSFEITPAGDYFYRHGKSLIKDFELIKQETIRRGEDHELTLTIGYPKNYDSEELQETVIEFSNIYPEVNISFVIGNHEELFQQLVRGKIDMKLSEQRRMFNDDYYNYELKSCQSYVEISLRDELSQKEKIDIEDLKSKSCIIIASNNQREVETEFYANILKIGHQFLFADSLSQARMMVLSARGFLLVDEFGRLPSTKTGIRRIPLYNKNAPIKRNYFLCWSKEKTNYYIEEFAELLKRKLNQ